MRPLSADGAELQATFSVEGAWPEFEITFESGDGRGRNTHYSEGVRLVLERLGDLGAVLVRARISSENVRQAGVDPDFTPRGFALPVGLDGVDHDRLRRGIGHAGARVNSRPGSSGSTTRKMTLGVTLPQPARSLEDLAAVLVSGGEGALQLTMVESLATIDEAMRVWLAALEQASRPVRGSLRRISEEAVVLQSRESRARAGALDVRLGVRSGGEPWTVEINAPRAAAAADALSTVATDASGRRWLLRQGWLRANPDSDGDVRGERFRILSGLRPAQVSGGTTPTPRDWYIVAALEARADLIATQTADFVHACAMARALSRAGESAPPVMAQLGAAERGGWFRRRAQAARPEREHRRLQGDVWLALRERLVAAGLDLVKPRHGAGYEVDGVVLGNPGTLIEIKTGAAAADVYEGVGQLLVYGRLLDLSGLRRVLLLPRLPRADLRIAAEGCELEVHAYQGVGEGDAAQVHFTDAFLAACGVPPSSAA